MYDLFTARIGLLSERKDPEGRCASPGWSVDIWRKTEVQGSYWPQGIQEGTEGCLGARGASDLCFCLGDEGIIPAVPPHRM